MALVYTTDSLARIETCGCKSDQNGGYMRRGAYLSRMRESGTPVFTVDLGNVVDARARHSDLKAEYAFRSLSALGYDIVNVGGQEYAYGLDRITPLLSSEGPQLLSSNLRPEDRASHGVTPWVVRSISDGTGEVRVGFIGITSAPVSQSHDSSRGFADPVQSVKEAMSVVRPQCDLVCLLAQMEPTLVRELLTQVEGINLVIAAPRSALTTKSETVRAVTVVYTSTTATHIGRIGAVKGEDGRWSFTPSETALSAEFGEDEHLKPLFEAYLDKVNAAEAERLRSGATALPTTGAQRYVGSATCGKCHSEILTTWQQTAHARAFARLEKVNRLHDPDCLSCHTTGYDRPGGYVDRSLTPGLDHVGCESCHGPGAGHVADPTVRLKKVTDNVCLSCHTPETSDFDPERYRKLVSHKQNRHVTAELLRPARETEPPHSAG